MINLKRKMKIFDKLKKFLKLYRDGKIWNKNKNYRKKCK